MSIRKDSRAFKGLGQKLGRGDGKHTPRLQLEQAPAGFKPPPVAVKKSAKVGGPAAGRPVITAAPDAGVELVPANAGYLQQVQERSAAARRARESQRGDAKQQVAEERRRQEEMQRIARETEERRASHEALGRTDGGRRGSDSSVVELDDDDDGGGQSHQRRGARGGARGEDAFRFSSADADADDFQPPPPSAQWNSKQSEADRLAAYEARDASKGRKRGGGGGSARPSLPGSSKSQIALPNEQYRPDHPMPQPSSSREQELEFPLNMPMRDIKLGTWACTTGDDVVEVTWRKKSVSFHSVEPNPSTRTGEMHEDFPELRFLYRDITKIEIDYQRRSIRLRGQGVFGDKVDEEVFSPFGNPEATTTWLVMSFAGKAGEFTASRSFLLKNVPELKSKLTVWNPSSLGGDAIWREAESQRRQESGGGRPTRGSRLQGAAANGQTSMDDFQGSSNPHGRLRPWEGQPPPPPPQNSMAGKMAERKRKKAEAAAKATDADNPHELSETSPENPFIPAEGRRRSNRLSAQGVGGTPRPTGDQIHPVLVYPNEDCKDAITLTNDDVWRLGNEEFLNDSLVDYYLKYIVTTLEDSPEGKAKLSRCHFFNSFFYKRLTECMGKSSGRRGGGKSPGSGYESVRRWTKNVDIFTKDFLFVPINESLHWSLAVVCWPGKIKDLTAPLPAYSFSSPPRDDRPDTPPAGAAASDRDLSGLHRVLSGDRRNAAASDVFDDVEADDRKLRSVLGDDDDCNGNEDYDDSAPAWKQDPRRDTQPAAAKKNKKQRLSKGGAGNDRTQYEEGVDITSPEKEKPEEEEGMEGGGGPGMDIMEGDESDDDGAGDERGTVEGGGRSKAIASAGQYGKADEEFEDAVEEAAGGSTSLVPYSGSGEGSDSEDDPVGDGGAIVPHKGAEDSDDAELGDDDAAAQSQADYPDEGSPGRQVGRPDAEEAAAIAAATAASAAESPRKGGKKRARADPTSFVELQSGAGPPPQIPCILYLDSLNGSKERALNLIRDYLLHEYRAKVLKQPVPSAASPGAGPSAAAPPDAQDLDGSDDEGEAGEEGAKPKAPEKRRTRGADRGAAAGGGEKEEAKPEPLGEKGWEELQAKFKSVRTANVRVPQQHNHYDCGVYMLKFIDQAANDTETMEAVSIDAMSEGRSELTQTRWSRFFNGAGEKIDGRMIDGLRVSIQETIENSGSHQQQSKKQKKGEGGPSGA